MNGISKFAMIPGVIAVLLSANGYAGSSTWGATDPITGLVSGTGDAITRTFFPKTTDSNVYVISDSKHNRIGVLDGVDRGMPVSSSGNMRVDASLVKGDKITHVETGRSGIITGIKHHGTMDVVGDTGKIVRYQYVTFKVKH